MKLFFSKDKQGYSEEAAWGYLIIITLIGIGISLFFVWPEFVFAFTDRFLRAGVWILVALIGFVVIWGLLYRHWQKEQDARGMNLPLFAGWIVLFGGLLGATVPIKGAREANEPDYDLYFNTTGKIKNYSDPSKKDFYFHHVTLNKADSLYIVEYNGEEPGYNNTWQSIIGDCEGCVPRSTNPRADEKWKIPKYNSSK